MNGSRIQPSKAGRRPAARGVERPTGGAAVGGSDRPGGRGGAALRTMGDDRLVTYMEATVFLNYSTQMLEYLERTGKLVPTVVLDPTGERMYTLGDLREYRDKYRRTDGLTMQEVMAKYGVTQDTVRWHFNKKRHLRPIGMRGHGFVYSHEDVEMVAHLESWIEARPHHPVPVLTRPLPRVKVGPSL